MLASYQLSLNRPSELGTEAFYAAKVVNTEELSARVHSALTKIGVLTTWDQEHHRNRLSCVDTAKITRNFAHQLPFCSTFMLRRIVSLLFVFEEQATRWESLDQEEQELKQLLRDPPQGMEAELQIRMLAILQRKAMLPSQLERGRAIDTELPMYSRE